MFSRKAHIILIGSFWFFSGVFAQNQKTADSLERIYLRNEKTGLEKLKLLSNLSYHETNDLKRAVRYADELIKLSEQASNDTFLRIGYFNKGTKKRMLGNLEDAMVSYLKSAEIAKKNNDLKAVGETYSVIADAYAVANDAGSARLYYNKAIEILRKFQPKTQQDSITFASVLFNAGDYFVRLKSFDSALVYCTEAKALFEQTHYSSGIGYCVGNLGVIYANIGRNDLAEKSINEAIRILEGDKDYYAISAYLTSMANVYSKNGDSALAINFAIRSLRLAEQYGLKEQIRDASFQLSEFYEKNGNASNALMHYKEYIKYRDSLSNDNVKRNMDSLRHNYEMSQAQIELAKSTQKVEAGNKLRIYLSIILGLAIVILATLIINNRNRRKAYKVLNLQKQETDKQKAKAEGTLTELQLTQKQLIQTAKMASLGELTAGIAHEIQNPLNFVNNFSDVSIELLDELKEDVINKLSDQEKASAVQIMTGLAANLNKIRDHGKRADSIVKGMLQHVRTSTGKKEPTDINALVDECLRLSYHGLRAKDKTFNAKFTEDFDPTIGKIGVVPQDIARVLLNLFNNAFYAVKEKKEIARGDFEPLVSVTTKNLDDKVELCIKDNGTGMPQNVLDKIFQPFFTTKPTGQGTGLGLSLSYDVVKAHGGELRVDTKEGEYAEFTILLPIGNNGYSS